MDSHLLPTADSSPLCSRFGLSIGARPAGSALSIQRIIVVTVPAPWPKPALGHPWLKASVSTITAAPVRSRMFAAVPVEDELSVEVFDLADDGYSSDRWTFDDPSEINPIIEHVASTPNFRHASPVTVPTFLVCTQGSHDQCCGLFGERLAAQIEAERPAFELRRVSHTGGHKFSPTLVALPSGRMWAFADLDLVDRIAADSITADDLSGRCRGWLGATGGVAQAAELAARSAWAMAHPEAGTGARFAAPLIEVGDLVDGRARCTVQVDGGQVNVEVRLGRVVPAVACESPGGLPAKQAQEYEWTVVEDPWN